jgi:lysophospholipase L1-like esterase
VHVHKILYAKVANDLWPGTAAGSPGRADVAWVAGWSASPVVGSDIAGSNCPAGAGLADQTVRNLAGVTRFQRDASGITGVRTVVLLEGVNDIGFDASACDIIAGYRRMIAASHAAGVRILGVTLTPFGGSIVDTPARRQTWQQLNDWIRHSGAFDGVVDFAVATADPADPFRLRLAYDSGDHLHPGDAGTRAMADAVDLTTLVGR